MPTPDQESADDVLLARLRPQALLARGLDDPDSPPPPPTPRTPSSSPLTSATEQAGLAATLAAIFPEFHVDGVISRGGFGTVYLAEHRQMKRRVALKILSGALTRNVSAVARFEREIHAIGAVDHPGIVRAFDAGERGGIWFLAMELVNGADFSSISLALGPLPRAEACELIRQAALALQHAHERGLIHRDVKPSNLMLAAVPDGQPLVKVLDFGLAQLAQNENTSGELTISGEVLGTVDYVAPEQVENPRTVDARADVYGLGATLYRLLSGHPPHQETDATSSFYARLLRITQEPCPGIATRCPELPPGLVAVVDRMVARDPAQRFTTGNEVAAALAPFAQGCDLAALLARVPAPPLTPLPPPSVVAPLPTPPLSGWRKKAIFVGAIAAALLFVGIALVWRGLAPKTDVSNTTNTPAASASRPGPVPEQIPTWAYTPLMVDAQTAPRIRTPDWRYQAAIRLGTPRGTHFHPKTHQVYFCAGSGVDGSICSYSAEGVFSRVITNVSAYTLAPAPDGDTVFWSDRSRGTLGRGSLSARTVTASVEYGKPAADASPLGMAFPPASWAGSNVFNLSDGLMVDAGTNSSKGLWQFSLDGSAPRQLVTNPDLLDEPVDVTFTQRQIYLVNRVRGRTLSGPHREEDFRQRILRLRPEDGRLVPCMTDQPIMDPCGIAWDPLSSDLYVLCGRQLESERPLRRVLRLRLAGQPDRFAVTEVITGLHRPTDAGIDISSDGQSLVLTLEGRGNAIICLFARGGP